MKNAACGSGSYNGIISDYLVADCLFCRIVSREIPAQIVFENKQLVVLKDINPQAPTHLLVIPKKHIARLSASTDDDAVLLGQLQRGLAELAAKNGLSSFRAVVNNGPEAGQTVDHLHYHLLGGRPMGWPPG